MTFSINCQACNRRYRLDQGLFERRVAGRIARFKCRGCGASSAIDALTEASLQPLSSSAEEPEAHLHESDFATEDREIAELTDEEVASLRPEALKPAARKPVPRPRLESKIDDELWVVSAREGADDQEIFESSLVHQIAEGKMPPEAIVWREGMRDWLPLADVPELAKHLPAADDKTGGFLGTGIRATFGSNSGERKSAPPPLPPKKRSYGTAKKKSGGHKSGEARGTKPVALSPGFLFSVEDAESEPPTPSAQDAKPAKGIPKPPLRGPRRAVTRDLDFSDIAEEDEPPLSGTPGLSQLTAQPRNQPSESSTTSPLFAGLGGDEEQVLGPPSIDISDLAGGKPRTASRDRRAASEQAQANDEAPAKQSGGAPAQAPSDSQGKPKRRKSERPRSSKRPSKRPVGRSNTPSGSTTRPGARGSEAPASAPRKSRQRWLSPARIVVLLALAALAYLIFSRQMRQAVEPPPAPNAQTESPEPAQVVKQGEEEPTLAEPQEAEPSLTEPAPAASEPMAEAVGVQDRTSRAQQQPAAPPARQTEARDAVEQPPVAEQPRAAAPQAPKPKPAPKSNQDAPPFDRSAAVAALDAVVAQASGCRQEGDPTGTARVVVTFAPSGRATSANLSGPPFAGTRTGGCIAATMRRAKVPPFSGDHVTVAKSVVIR